MMINAYLVDDIVLHRASAYDKYNEPLPDAEIKLKGKVEIKTTIVKDIKGENVISSMSVMLKTTTITHEDFIEFDGKEYAIITFSKPRDFSWGYMEVFLK